MLVAGVVTAKLQAQRYEAKGYIGWLACKCGHVFFVPMMKIAMRGSGPCPRCDAVKGLRLVKEGASDETK